MNVSIIGTGNMAKGIGLRLAGGGHQIQLHAKDQAKGQALASEIGHDTSVVAVGTPTHDVVVLAIPYNQMQSVADSYQAFAGKIVIDITNPVDFDTLRLIPAPGTSGAETVAALLPEANVVKAFNTVFSSVLAAGQVSGQVPDVFVVSDGADAKSTVVTLINSSGLRAIDAGSLAHARHLEGMGLIHMSIQATLGTNWQSAVQIVS